MIFISVVTKGSKFMMFIWYITDYIIVCLFFYHFLQEFGEAWIHLQYYCETNNWFIIIQSFVKNFEVRYPYQYERTPFYWVQQRENNRGNWIIVWIYSAKYNTWNTAYSSRKFVGNSGLHIQSTHTRNSI